MLLGLALMGVLALGAIGSIVVPLWRTPRAAGLQSGESNLALWRQEREEILRDADNGVRERAAAALECIQRRRNV